MPINLQMLFIAILEAIANRINNKWIILGHAAWLYLKIFVSCLVTTNSVQDLIKQIMSYHLQESRIYPNLNVITAFTVPTDGKYREYGLKGVKEKNAEFNFANRWVSF